MTQVITPDYIQLDNQSSAPGTPPKGVVRLYVKTTGDIYIKNDAGSETDFVGGVINLDGFSDVVITSPSNGDYLRYDSGTSKWINDPFPTPNVVNMDDFTDVVITSLAVGDILVYESGSFVNDQNQPAVLSYSSTSFDVPDSGGGDFDYVISHDQNTYGDTVLIDGTSLYLTLRQTASATEDLGVYLLTAYLDIARDGSNTVDAFLYELGSGATTVDSTIQLGSYDLSTSDVSTVFYCPVIVASGKQYTLGFTKANDGDYPSVAWRVTWEKLGHSI